MDFRKNKLRLVLGIMASGMLAALLFHAWEGWFMKRGYPYNTFLTIFTPYTDYSDMVLSLLLPCPYMDPSQAYSPFAYFFLRLPAFFPEQVGLIGSLFVSLAALMLLFVRVFETIIPNPWLRVGSALLAIGLSYPILMAVDRGNMEIMLAPLVAWGLYSYGAGRYGCGTLCLVLGGCMKIYLLLFLIFLVRQRKYGLIVASGVGVVALTFISLCSFASPVGFVWSHYTQNVVNFTSYDIAGMEESASPWLTYKLTLIFAADWNLIPPILFDGTGPFIVASYGVYQAGAMAFILFFAVYSCFIEKEFQRCVAISLLFVSAVFPTGADYRMLYACIALAILVLIKTRRPCDWIVLVLVALLMIPKKYYFFSLVSYPQIPDISIQVILNPLFTLTAMALLIYDGFRNYDSRWAALRIRRYLSPFGLLRRPTSQS